MGISNSVRRWALGAGLVGLCVAAWMAVSATRAPRPLVYIGSFTAVDDRSFARLAQALRDRHPEQLARHPLRYVRASDKDMQVMFEQISAACDLDPAVLIAPTADTARAAVRLGGRCPVVFSSYQHPVATGIVDEMVKPRSQRMAGVSLADRWHDKRLELMRESFPQARTLAILGDRSWAESENNADRVMDHARRHAFTPRVFLVESGQEIDALMTSPTIRDIDAWYIPASYAIYLNEGKVIQHLARLDVPAMHTTLREVKAGALMAYARDTEFVYDALAELVARVSDGEDPATIPIAQPWRMLLAVRPREGTGPRRHLPAHIVQRADEVL